MNAYDPELEMKIEIATEVYNNTLVNIIIYREICRQKGIDNTPYYKVLDEMRDIVMEMRDNVSTLTIDEIEADLIKTSIINRLIKAFNESIDILLR